MDEGEMEMFLRTFAPAELPPDVGKGVLAGALQRLQGQRRPWGRGGFLVALAAAALFCFGLLGWLWSTRPAGLGSTAGGGHQQEEDNKSLIADLGDSRVELRDRASRTLLERAERNPTLLLLLRSTAEKGADPEVRARARELVEAVQDAPYRHLQKLKLVRLGTLRADGKSFGHLEFSPDGTRLLTTHWEGPALRVKLWDPRKCEAVATSELLQEFRGEMIRFLPQGTEIAAFARGKILFLDPEDLRRVRTAPSAMPFETYVAPVPNPRDATLFVYPEQGQKAGKTIPNTLVLGDTRGNELARRTFGSRYVGGYLQWSPDGAYLMTDVQERGRPHDLTLLGGRNLETIATFRFDDPEEGRNIGLWINDAAISSDGKFIVTQSMEAITVLDASTLKPVASTSLKAMGGTLRSDRTWMIGSLIVTWETRGQEENILILAFSPRRKEISILERIERGDGLFVAVSPDGRTLVYSHGVGDTSLEVVGLESK
jgi:hypothetical protein